MKTENSFSLKSVLVALFMIVSATAMAQTTVTGTIVDDAGEPVIGATIREVGTQNATVTDFDGNYSVKVSNENATLSISYVGFQTEEVKLAGRKTVSLSLKADNELLDEVVVVGYGVQKKKLVTGATVEVKGEDITKLNTTQVLGALQSQTPGVNIQSASGQPGDGFKISIRGAGTNGDTKPLYVIDGVSGGDINAINPADIERIDVLKDAASCAIYGSAAANGVILVTTKSGKAGSVVLTYDGNIGWSNTYRLPQMLTAKQYMDVMDMTRVNTGFAPYQWEKYIDADLLAAYRNGTNTGTDWIDAFRNKNAVTTNHALSVSGGNDRSTYSMGVGYQYQDGVFGGPVKTDFSRFTIRLNSDHVVYRANDRDIIKIGENLYFQHRQSQGVQIGNQYANDFSNMLRANPLIPIYNKDGDYFMYDDLKNSGTHGWFDYNLFSGNPIAQVVNSQSGNNSAKSYNLNATGYVEVSPFKGLTYRGQGNYTQYSNSYRSFLPIFMINGQAGGFRNETSVTDNVGVGYNWSTTHTLNYKIEVSKHNIDILAGTEYSKSRPWYGESVNVTATGLIFDDMLHAYIHNAENRNSATADGYPSSYGSKFSYFGRLNYNFAERYMISAIFRADGSSKFRKGKQWGYFPSVSAGWVISNEKFMAGTSSWLEFLKLRAGWGQNGNDNIDASQWYSGWDFGAYGQYSFNNVKEIGMTGAYPNRLANPDLSWETSEQTNVGLDARFLRGRLSLTVDWYNKMTKNLLIAVPIKSILGFSTQVQNAGSVKNTGIEAAIGWNDNVGDFRYGINWNMAWNKNKVTQVNTPNKFVEGGNDNLAQSTGIIARMEEGFPIGYFYGYKTAGVIQNAADRDAYLQANCKGDANNSIQGSSIGAGDLKFVDVNGDGVINDLDKTYLGDPHPDITMGLSFNLGWKGLDFAVTAYGAFGQQVARSYRKFSDGPVENYTTEVYEHWHGEGTSNKYPLLGTGSTANWMKISDIYIENASYVRIQNVTLGYDFASLLKNSPFQQLRLYVAAQNLWTFTGYKGMDPENGKSISSEQWVTGVDVGNYPQPRTYMVGVNIKFQDKKQKKAEAPVYVQSEPKYIEKIVEKVVEKPVTKEVKTTEYVQNTYVVTFEVNSYQIANTAELAGLEKGQNVEVVAYSSPEGNADANKVLSQKRADAVADYLKSKGVNVTRVLAKGADSEHANRIAIVTVK